MPIKHTISSITIIAVMTLFFIGVHSRIGAAQHDNLSALPSPQKMLATLSQLAYGQQVRQIGTFNGWTMWMGWDGSFSENYNPFSETYYWMVYFAPEGLFVALQSAKSNYSNVDTYAAYDYFYGTLQSPFGSILPSAYIDSLKGVTLSINAFDSSFAPVGPLSQLSMAVTSGQTFFRIGSLKTLQRGIQFSAGMNVSFSLMPFSLPFCVSLDYESKFEAGFYPIILWNIDPTSSNNPVDKVIEELHQVAANADTQSFPGYYEKEIADMMIPFLETLPSSPLLREFMASTNRDSHIDNMISHAQDWLRTGDTSKLPGSVALPMPPEEQYATMRPVKAITDMCFELGFEHGYRSKNRDDTIYADCIITVHCKPAHDCTLEATAEEVAELVPGSHPENFEGVGVGFDTTPESQAAGGEEIYWTTIESGVASYTFVNNTDTPLFLGVQVYADPATGNKTLELCRRKVVFEETFVVPETDYDDIEYDNQTRACAATSVLSDEERCLVLPVLRTFRDTLLLHDAQGKQLIALYYRLSPWLTVQLRNSPALRTQCRTLLFSLLPTVTQWCQGGSMSLAPQAQRAIDILLSDIAAGAPEPYRRDIEKVRLLLQR
ncbi:MAG: hypothetical protein N3B18_03255 [Desulfobacterota bacterium]|nr:hypothetical protein [Thermodesulfobacteriota bacterium]